MLQARDQQQLGVDRFDDSMPHGLCGASHDRARLGPGRFWIHPHRYRRLRRSQKSLAVGEQPGSAHRASAARSKKLVSLSSVLLLIMLLATTSQTVLARQNAHQTCPGCPHQQHAHLHRSNGREPGPSPDDLRLEAIKHQILSKLGLKNRPDVNRTMASVPKRLALETIYRAEAQQTAQRAPNPEAERYQHHGGNYDRNRASAGGAGGSSTSSFDEEYGFGGGGGYDEYTYRHSNNIVASAGSGAGGAGGGSAAAGPVDAADPMIDRDNVPPFQDYEDMYAAPPPRETEVMDDFYARTSEIITFAEPGRTLNGQPLLEFPLASSSEPAFEPLSIKKATLWARVELRHAHHYQHHRNGVNSNNQRNITLWVFRVRCGNVTHLRGKDLGQHLELVTSLAVNIGQLGWQKFDVTRPVSNWYQSHHLSGIGRDRRSSSSKDKKLTLLVDCTGCGSHVHVSTFGGHSPHVVEPSLNSKRRRRLFAGTQDPDRPFLVVRTDPAAVKRVRRRAIECTGAVKGQCCKQRFYVSFSQLGWDDWIIAPQGYYANYCRGDCAAGHRTPDTFPNYYTHVIEEYRKMDRLAGMQPCCAPLKFSPMSLIYYGPDSNIIKRDLPKMIVDECGCP
ncbi:uncharacterized protein LOC106649912 isoform X2 [Trichogramma pretiosum]|uniref:uncharacterized protein LOC106649912 isoform X2 n=1 Tax=Trichogramma pretiosum TaxID=7493 RepID=UPI000C719CBE|nr:uncharacterized protein LOC106649912 isoform X2 [Trichogramma pretiosum]